MWRFSLALAFVAVGSAQDSSAEDYRAQKCAFIKKEIASGHKAYLSKQHWFQRLARVCGFSDDQAFAIPAQRAQRPVLARPVQAEFNAVPMKDALGWAKSAITSKEGAELKSEATKLALKAKMAFEHQDTQELKEGAADFMGKLKELWDKSADEETKLKAAVLLNKAKQTLEAKGVKDLPEKVVAVEKQLEAAKENLAGGNVDLAELASAARGGNLQGQAAGLLKMAMKKPETELLANKAAETLEKLKASGLDAKVLQAFQKAETKLGPIHV
ncbi:unnamed protein product [Symbiodinium sp. CCMP2592]|nr:unnamed protein product [Symbiodinium sp. CCMP2592]